MTRTGIEISADQMEVEAARKQFLEQHEKMRVEAEQTEQQRMELKHLIVENEKEGAEAKKAAEKAKKQAITKKTLTEEEQSKELKGLAVYAGMMRPPNTTQVAGAMKSGKGKGKNGVEAPKGQRAREM